MKIAFVGNQDNNAYRLCKWFRASGYACDLYTIPGRDIARSLPEEIDVELKAGYPEWIRVIDPGGQRFWYLKKDICRVLEGDYDVIVSAGQAGLLTMRGYQGQNHVHQSLGSEVTMIPLWRHDRSVPQRRRVDAHVIHKNLTKARKIITGFLPTIRSLQQQGFGEKTAVIGFPEDARNLQKRDSLLLEELTHQYSRYKRVFVWLSRLEYTQPHLPAYKGVEKFLEAYERFYAVHPDVHAIIGSHGSDAESFMKEVDRRGLGRAVDFVPHQPFYKLLSYLSIPNAIVFDELDSEKGELSGIARETLSVGGVIVKSLDEELNFKSYGAVPPILDAHDTQSCHAAMEIVYQEPLQVFQERSKEWSRAYLSPENMVQRYAEILRSVI